MTLVVSHCNESMPWMQEYLKNIPIKKVTVYSKCNTTVQVYTLPLESKIIHMPNLGRCDHSYAHWMKNMDQQYVDDNHLVLLLKASRYLYQNGMQYRPLREVIRIVMDRGFSCEAKHVKDSIYYRTHLLRNYNISIRRGVDVKSHYIDMGQWLDDLAITFYYSMLWW